MHIGGNWRDPSPRSYVAHAEFPLLARFVGKFVLDILPAALASVIGGFLFTQYQLSRAAPPLPAEQMSFASAEVLALVRDEHEAIVGYLKSQIAAEKSRLAAQDAETARAVADAKAAQDNEAQEKALAEQNAVDIKLSAAMPARHLASAMSAKAVLPRAKPAAAPAPAPSAQPTGPVVFTAQAKGIWVKFYDGDASHVLLEKQLAEGESFTLPAEAKNPMIWTGRPEALAITIGGQPQPKLADAQKIMRDVPVSATALLARQAAPAAPAQPAMGPTMGPAMAPQPGMAPMPGMMTPSAPTSAAALPAPRPHRPHPHPTASSGDAAAPAAAAPAPVAAPAPAQPSTVSQ